MIDKEKFHVFNYVKKDEYTASMDGMRYMLKKKDKEEGSVLEVINNNRIQFFKNRIKRHKRNFGFFFHAQGF